MLIFGFPLYLQHVHASCSYRDTVDFEKENSSLLSISENIEALANEETSDSGLRGTCLGNVGPCISYCPSCNRTIKGDIREEWPS